MRFAISVILCILLLAGCQTKEDAMDTKNANLLLAAEQGNSAEITKLLEAGADINTVDHLGRTSAMIAVHTKQLDIFKLLIEKGADINIRDHRSDNPLLYAGAEGLLEFVRASVAAGADTTLTNRFGGSALIPAADRGHVDVVKELLATSDVNIDHVNNLGWTALLEAVLLGDGGPRHQEIIKLLVQYGADVNLADSQGVTPLQHAKRLGYDKMVQTLEQAGAK